MFHLTISYYSTLNYIVLSWCILWCSIILHHIVIVYFIAWLRYTDYRSYYIPSFFDTRFIFETLHFVFKPGYVVSKRDRSAYPPSELHNYTIATTAAAATATTTATTETPSPPATAATTRPPTATPTTQQKHEESKSDLSSLRQKPWTSTGFTPQEWDGWVPTKCQCSRSDTDMQYMFQITYIYILYIYIYVYTMICVCNTYVYVIHMCM